MLSVTCRLKAVLHRLPRDKRQITIAPVTIQLCLDSLSSRDVVEMSPVVAFTVNLLSASPSAITYVNAVLAAVNIPHVTGSGHSCCVNWVRSDISC